MPLLALFGCGCAAAAREVPMPPTTPFARGSVEEASYLQLFRAGYEAALRGEVVTYCLFEADWEDSRWLPGREDGRMASWQR